MKHSPSLHGDEMETDNGRTDRIDVAQIDRNRRTMLDSTVDSPFVEEISAGEANYGEALYDNLPEDRVGFMTNGHKRR